jgi:peroxiredoxin
MGPMSQTPQRFLQAGDRAPDFVVRAVETDGTISLADYRKGNGLLLALFRGLYCPFCRRHLATLASYTEKLKPLAIESLAVVATELENARLYYRFRPTRLPVAVDPELTTHRSYAVPRLEPTPEFIQAMESVHINPNGMFPGPMTFEAATIELERRDGYKQTDVDRRDNERQFPQLCGQFLIDRDGVIRWANIECAVEGAMGVGKFPTLDELLDASRIAR